MQKVNLTSNNRSFRDVAHTVVIAQKAISRMSLAKDLWPSEHAMIKAGIMSENGGFLVTDWLEITETLTNMKKSAAECFRSSDRRKELRQLGNLIQLQQPANIKLSELKKIDNQLKAVFDAVVNDVFNAAEYKGNVFSGETCSKIWPVKNLKQLVTDKERNLRRLMQETSQATFGFSVEEISLDDGSALLTEKLKQIEKWSGQVNGLQMQVLKLESELFEILDYQLRRLSNDMTTYSLLPAGPAGSAPIHLCIMMNLKKTGIKIIERYYNSPELLSCPVLNDLDAWRIKKAQNPWEDGLYTGESALHMAIVQEDADLVRYLLESGISLASRATGLFFQPKMVPRRVSGADRSEPCPAGTAEEALVKNDFSACYYGEFPLSFGASVGSCEICEALYQAMRRRLDAHRAEEGAAGARPVGPEAAARPGGVGPGADVACFGDMRGFLNATDSLGNTAMHLAAMHDRRGVIDWLSSKEGGREALEALNWEGLTPLTLAARYGHVATYQHILHTCLSTTVWVFGRVRLRQTDLLQVDTHRVRGAALHASPRWRSVLEIAVAYELEALADDALLNKLVQSKWAAFGRRAYMRQVFLPYAALLACFAAVAANPGTGLSDSESLPAAGECVNLKIENNHTAFESGSVLAFLGKFALAGKGAAAVAEATRWLLYCCGPAWLVNKSWRHGWLRATAKDLDRDGDGSVSWGEVADFLLSHAEGVLDLAAATLLAGAALARAGGSGRAEADCLACASVALFLNLLHVLAPFRFFGGLTVTVHKMLRGDVSRFMVLYLAMHTGFAFGRRLLLLRTDGQVGPADAGLLHDLFSPFWVAMGDGLSNVMEHCLVAGSPTLLLGFHVVWIFLSNIVLINLLVAMMAKTFDEDYSQVHALWFFPFAARILQFERNLLPADRSRFRCGIPCRLSTATRRKGDLDQPEERFVETHMGEIETSSATTKAADMRCRMRARQEAEGLAREVLNVEQRVVKLNERMEQVILECNRRDKGSVGHHHDTRTLMAASERNAPPASVSCNNVKSESENSNWIPPSRISSEGRIWHMDDPELRAADGETITL